MSKAKSRVQQRVIDPSATVLVYAAGFKAQGREARRNLCSVDLSSRNSCCSKGRKVINILRRLIVDF